MKTSSVFFSFLAACMFVSLLLNAFSQVNERRIMKERELAHASRLLNDSYYIANRILLNNTMIRKNIKMIEDEISVLVDSLASKYMIEILDIAFNCNNALLSNELQSLYISFVTFSDYAALGFIKDVQKSMMGIVAIEYFDIKSNVSRKDDTADSFVKKIVRKHGAPYISADVSFVWIEGSGK